MKRLLYGAERYFLQEKATQIVKDECALDFLVQPLLYDCERYMFDWDQLFEELMTVSFFESHKIIYLLNPQAAYSDLTESKSKLLIELLENLPEEVILFLMVETPSFDRRLKIYKPFLQAKEAYKIASLNPLSFKNMVRELCKKENIQLSSVVFEHLISRLPMHVITLQSEINKLSNYPQTITIDVINQLISKPMADSVFELSKAIMLKDHKQAWNVYEDLLILKHDPTSLIPAIAWQYRIMFQILHYKEEKLSQHEIAQQLDEHEYTFNKAWQYANKTTKNKVMGLLDQLATLDQSIKIGKTDKKIGFERFLLEAMR